MSLQNVTFAMTRPKILVPALFGIGLALGGISMFWGLGFVAFSILQASRLLSTPELNDLLRLRAEKRKHGINRLLNDEERHEILAIDQYARRLLATGADAKLAKQARDQAWSIIHERGENDASCELQLFRQSLPALNERVHAGANKLAGKISHELDILRATRREVESLNV